MIIRYENVFQLPQKLTIGMILKGVTIHLEIKTNKKNHIMYLDISNLQRVKGG